jgi:phosphoribosylanthranilate isomerase
MIDMASKTRLKICGNTNREDVRLVGDSGADYCGILVDVGFSERTLTLPHAAELAKESKIPVVILMCDPEPELVKEVDAVIKPFAVQLLGHESPEMVKKMKSAVRCQIWKTVHLPVIPEEASPDDYIRAGIDALLIDSFDTSEGFARLGGTGKLADWKAASAIIKTASVPVFLAGGINPENIQKAVAEVRPFGIDLCSGVESTRGKKDPEKLRTLVSNLKSARSK